VLWFLLLAYVAITLFALLVAERVMFQPPASSYARTQLPVTLVPVADADSVAVVYLPDDDARFTILHSHGNAEDLGQLGWLLEELRGAGFAVVAYDYRGYGQSSAVRPTAARAVADAEAVYRYAVGVLGVPPHRLVVHGRSVGSGPALELAARHEVAGVILESAFTSAYRVITRVRLLPFDRFPNLDRVRQLDRPVLVIHGTRDGIVPFSHGRQLYAAAAVPKHSLWVEGAGHNDLVLVAGDRYRQALSEFARLLAEHRPAR
jgi:abhydrolase domain-containing protein 17